MKLTIIKKKKAPVKLTADELKDKIKRMHEINLELKTLEKEFDKLQAPVIATLGLKGIFQFGTLRCLVTRALRRDVKWRLVCFELARQLYPTRKDLFIWLKGIVRRFPKKPTKMWVVITKLKEEKVDQEAM